MLIHMYIYIRKLSIYIYMYMHTCLSYACVGVCMQYLIWQLLYHMYVCSLIAADSELFACAKNELRDAKQLQQHQHGLQKQKRDREQLTATSAGIKGQHQRWPVARWYRCCCRCSWLLCICTHCHSLTLAYNSRTIARFQVFCSFSCSISHSFSQLLLSHFSLLYCFYFHIFMLLFIHCSQEYRYEHIGFKCGLGAFSYFKLKSNDLFNHILTVIVLILDDNALKYTYVFAIAVIVHFISYRALSCRLRLKHFILFFTVFLLLLLV